MNEDSTPSISIPDRWEHMAMVLASASTIAIAIAEGHRLAVNAPSSTLRANVVERIALLEERFGACVDQSVDIIEKLSEEAE